MTLAEKFIAALSSMDAFTLREMFVSLGTSDNNHLVIGFADGSQVCNRWVNIDDSIHDVNMTRKTPNSPWEQIIDQY